jgi:hypothetical protein
MKIVHGAVTYEPPLRVIPYALCAFAGVLLTFYQPPSFDATSSSVSGLIHTVLIGSSLVASFGALSQFEKYELSGITVMCGPLLAYAGLLFYGGSRNPDPSRFASFAVGCFLAALAAVLVLFALTLRKFIHESELGHESELEHESDGD